MIEEVSAVSVHALEALAMLQADLMFLNQLLYTLLFLGLPEIFVLFLESQRIKCTVLKISMVFNCPKISMIGHYKFMVTNC